MATIILKATEDCNSNCIYCDVIRKERKTLAMSYEMLELVFIRINEFLLAHPDEKITLTWHGGEPLLLGTEYFQAAFEFQEKYCFETKSRIEHCLQSNVTLFTDDFVDTFRKLGITQIGTSYDPEPYIRGPGQKIDSDKYNQMFIKGISLLEKNGFGWGVIYVVTRKSLKTPLDVFFFLTNMRLDGGFSLNPVLVYDDRRKYIAITPYEYTEFLGTIFPIWWKYPNRYPTVEPYKSLTDSIKRGMANLGCVDSGRCAYNHLNIAPDGETSHCGRSSDWGLLKYGNIQDRSLAKLFKDNQRDQLMERNETLQKTECEGCRFWKLCHGGCPLDAFSKYKSFAHKTEWCDAKRGFIEKYFEPVTGIKYGPHK